MPTPDRVFVIVVESEGDRDHDTMPLLRQTGPTGVLRTAAFSSLLLATTFLSQAQQLGHFVKLDYIFPADARRLAQDFPEFEIRLDPSPEAFFGAQPTP